MQYENRQPPEGINITKEHPLKQFLRLLFAALVLLVLIVFVLQFSGAWLAKRIPFSAEQSVIERMHIDFKEGRRSSGMDAYLGQLANRLLAGMPIPEGMDITIHYSDEDTFNAFATIGGNLIFYRGLLERLPNENALAMVLAHEIAHVLHRDPVAGLGGGLASAAALAMLTGNAGTGMAGRVIGQAGVLTGMEFTRRMEREADAQGLAAVAGLYGHVAGADELFKLIAGQRGDDGVPAWLGRFVGTHPLDADRVATFARLAKKSGWSVEGAVTPLPDEFQAWLDGDS